MRNIFKKLVFIMILAVSFLIINSNLALASSSGDTPTAKLSPYLQEQADICMKEFTDICEGNPLCVGFGLLACSVRVIAVACAEKNNLTVDDLTANNNRLFIEKKCAADSEGDGIQDVLDNCPAVDNPDQVDKDNDGIGDACDNCPNLENADQIDSNGDHIGDVCTPIVDTDNDGIADDQDNCPALANEDQQDGDTDGVGDACDNCKEFANPAQTEQEVAGCQDADGDGVADFSDKCPDVWDPTNTAPKCVDSTPLIVDESVGPVKSGCSLSVAANFNPAEFLPMLFGMLAIVVIRKSKEN